MNWNSTLKPSTKPLKRSGFKVRYSASNALTIPVKPRKPMKSRKKAPTAQEREWMAFVAGFGCVVCWLQHQIKTPCAVHHIIEGSRRLGHLFTIGLCDPGHHQNTPDRSLKISRHPDKARFELEYGTEYELHAYLLTQYEIREHR
jgi:hypothetical protein